KKCPISLTFDPNDELHIAFIESFANLWADVFGLQHKSRKTLMEIVKKLKPSIFIPSDETKISVTDEEEKERLKELSNHNEINELIESLPKSPINNIKPLIFEKDDDTNFHIDFITATSNLRATNYNIKLA